jgi:hypothetical protein
VLVVVVVVVRLWLLELGAVGRVVRGIRLEVRVRSAVPPGVVDEVRDSDGAARRLLDAPAAPRPRTPAAPRGCRAESPASDRAAAGRRGPVRAALGRHRVEHIESLKSLQAEEAAAAPVRRWVAIAAKNEALRSPVAADLARPGVAGSAGNKAEPAQ